LQLNWGIAAALIDAGEIKFKGTFEELHKNDSIISEYLTV
jgi:ABC-type branched-subunit amino acid transport system ATPase component